MTGPLPRPSGAHLVTEWGIGGVNHRRCSCGVEGSGTAAEAEAAVAECRAARAAEVAS
jgi:hypothetical protein